MPAVIVARRVAWRGVLARAVLFAMLAFGPKLLAADDHSPEQREANRRKVGQMTQNELWRLQENAREFQQLSTDQQAKLRELQQAIDRDPGLQAALRQYQDWASQLTPWQRSELRRATDAKARMALVHEFQRRAGPDLMNPPVDALPSHSPDQSQVVLKILGPIRPPPVPLPTPNEFAALMEILESELPAERQEVLLQMDSFTRQVRVFNESIARFRDGGFGRRPNPDDDLARRMLDALDEGSPAQNHVESLPDVVRRMVVFGIAFRGLITELILTVDLAYPTNDEIARFEQALSPSQRDRIAKQPPEEWLPEVRLLCLEAKVPGIRDFRASSRTFEMMSRPEWRFPSGRDFDRNRPGQPPDDRRGPPRPDQDRRLPILPDRGPSLPGEPRR